MMKSFSKFNLIKSKLFEGKKSFLDLLLEPKYQYVDIEVPHYDYLRGNVLLSDIEMVAEDCSPINIAQLIYLLYLQFLHQVRKGTSLDSLSHSIILKMEEYDLLDSPTIRKKNTKLAPVSPNLFALQEFEEKDPLSVRKEKTACITLRMKISEIYRGEILLHDMYQLNNEYELNVEQLMAMLYIDFIHTIKREGNDEELIKRILQAFDYYDQFM